MKTPFYVLSHDNLINQNKYKNIMVVQADVGAVNFKKNLILHYYLNISYL